MAMILFNALRVNLQGGGNYMSELIKKTLTEKDMRDKEAVSGYIMGITIADPWGGEG